MTEFSVTFLGTADASLNPRAPTATCLVKAAGTRIMIDAGIGAHRQLRRAGIKSRDIDIMLVTHWHLDHYLGLPEILVLSRRKAPLMLFGPGPSLIARLYVHGLLRVAHVYSGAVTENFIKDCGGLRLEAVPTSHGDPSLGWLIVEKAENRRLVYSGDTEPADGVLAAARGADLLIHEATFPDAQLPRAKKSRHSTPSQAADIARRAGAGALALTHVRPGSITPQLLAEAQLIFPQVIVPSLLDRIFIEPAPASEREASFGWGRVRLEPPALP